MRRTNNSDSPAPAGNPSANAALRANRRTSRGLHIGLLVIAALICVYESFTKGWLSFFFIPALVIVLPLLFIGQVGFRAELYGFSRRVYRAIISLRALQVAGLLALYICGIGFGDTEEVRLFGLVSANVNSPLTVLSGLVSTAGGAVFGAASIALLTFFVVSLLQKRIRRRFARAVD